MARSKTSLPAAQTEEDIFEYVGVRGNCQLLQRGNEDGFEAPAHHISMPTRIVIKSQHDKNWWMSFQIVRTSNFW